MKRFVWVLVVCLLLAGCTATDPGTNATRTTTAAGGTTTISASPTPTLGTQTVDTPARTPTEGERVTVTRVVDGDTIEIRYANGTADTVRLIGVDTPEVHVPNTPDEYEGVPTTDTGEACLRAEGHDASAFIRQVLAGERVRLVGNERGRYGRLLAFVFEDGRNVNYRLVREGYARVYDSRFSGRERFYRTETRAQRKHLGLWRCSNESERPEPASAPRGRESLAVVEITADAPGNDNANPNAESVVFENTGQNALALDGWTVRDAADHAYSFPDRFVLEPGERVTLRTGRGPDSQSELHWGATSAVWNNDGDTITVRNAAGELAVRRSYA